MKTPSWSLRNPAFIAAIILSTLVQFARAGTDVWNGGGGSQNLFWFSGFNWQAGTLPQIGDQLVFTNTVGLLNSNNYPAGTIFSGITFQTPAGAFVLNGNSVTLTNNITDLQPVTAETVNLPLIVNTPFGLNLNVTGNGVLNLNNVISGTGNLTNSGAGTVNLNGSNTISGQLVINGGTVVVNQETNLPAPPAVPTAGDIVINGGTLQAATGFLLNTNRNIALGPVSGSGSGTLGVSTGTVFTNNGILANNGAGTGGLSKIGFGNLILSGGNGGSTYTGPTTNTVGFLTLDFTQPISPANNIISSSSALSMGGGNSGLTAANYAELLMAGKAGGASSQTFAGASFTTGASFIVASNGASGTVNLSLGALNHSPGSGLVLVTPSQSGGGNVTTSSGNVNGILGGWVTISGDGNAASLPSNTLITGTNYACVDINGNIVNFNNYYVMNAANHNTLHAAVDWNTTGVETNILVGDPSGVAVVATNDIDNNVGTTTDINSIKFYNSPTTGGAGVYIGLNNTLRLGVYGGILSVQTANTTPVIGGISNLVNGTTANQAPFGSQNVGTLTAGGPNPNTPGEIVITHYTSQGETTGGMIVAAQIADNGSGTVTVVKMGNGSIKLDGNNTYSGGLYMLEGRVQWQGTEIDATGNGGLGGTNGLNDGAGFGPVYILPGSYFAPSTAIPNITNAFFVAGVGDAQENFGVFRAGNFGGNITMIGDTALPSDAANIFGPIHGPFNLTLGAPGRKGTLSLASPGDDWTGNTLMFARTDNNVLVSSNNEVIPNGFGKGNVIMTNGSSGFRFTWDMNGFSETVNGLSTSPNFAGTLLITCSNGVASTLTIGDNDQGGVFGGIISNTIALTKIGAGVETLTNVDVYKGATTVSNGVLQLTGVGSIPNSPQVNIFGGSFDVSQVSYSIPATQTINVSGGTLFVSSANSASTPVNFTNGTLEVTALNVGSANLTAPTVNLGASTANVIQPANIPLLSIYPDTFPVIHYTSALNANGSVFAPRLPAGYGGFVSNDTPTKTIYLVLTNGPVTPFLTWVGAVGNTLNSTWDFITSDWTNSLAHTTASYVDGSLVNFTDAGRTNVVNIIPVVAPAGVTVTNSNTYTFVGPGGIGGTNGLTKLGVGTLILDNTGTNTFTAALTIGAGGTVQMGNFDTAGSLGAGAIADNGSLLIKRTDNPVVPNSISGSGAIQQLGTNSTLTLGGNNGSFSGTIWLTNNGTLQGGSSSTTALGATNSVDNVASGSMVDANGVNLGGAQIYISGIGVTNSDGTTNGAIINSSAAGIFPAVARVTMLGDTVFGAPGATAALPCTSVLSNRWDLRSPTTSDANGASLTGNGHNLIKVSMNQVGIVGATVDSTLANIDVQNGILSIEAATTGLGDPSKTLTVENGADLSIYQATNQFNKNIVLNGNGINNNLGTVNNTSGNNTIGGPVTVNGDVQITFRSAAGNAASGALIISNLVTGMSGSGSLTKNDTNTLTVGGLDTHSGGTIINDGTFILNGMSTAAANSLTINTHTLAVATTLGGNGTNKGPVVVNDTMWPGVGGKPSSFGAGNGTVSPSFQFVPGASVIFNLGSTTTAGGGVNDLINVNGDFDAGGANVQINPVGVLTTSGAYTLANYTGSMLSSSFNQNVNVVPAAQPSRYVFSVSYPAHQVQLTVTTGVGLMEWNGASGDGLWNVQNSQNWTNTATSTPQSPKDYQFLQGDQVVLDDSIIASGGTNVLTITTNNPVQPASFTVNSTTNYTIQGPGSIAGTLNITKGGSSTLRIDTANTFSGTVTITNGILLVNNANALGSTNNTIIVTNSGVLDVGGPSFAANANPIIGYRLVMLSGFGASGPGTPTLGALGANNSGCLINSSANAQENSMQNVLLTSDTAIGCFGPINGAGRFDIGRQAGSTFSTGGHAYNLYKVGTNQVSLVNCAVDPALGNIDIQGGELGFETGSGFGDPTKTLTVESGAVLEFYETTNSLSKTVIVNGGALAEGRYPNIYFNGGGIPNNSISGPVTITNGIVVVGGPAAGTISNAISGPSALTIAGAVYLDGTNTYTGNTIVSNGTLFLVGTASINSSTNITVRSGATIDPSGRVDGTLTLASWQILGGSGIINGGLTNLAGSISLTGTNGIFSVTTNATLGGSFTNQIGQGSNTVFAVGGNLVYGGTLVVTTNAASTAPLAAGQSYKLFSAPAYNNGTFSSVTLPGLPAGLIWTNGLAVDGTIGIVNNNPVIIPTIPATIQGFGLSGTNVVISGTNAVNGGTYYLLSSTNVALPIHLWSPVSTNVVNTNGTTGNGFSLTATNVFNTNNAQFYILSNTN